MLAQGLFSGYIIAILAAILFPVFAKAREKARQASCLSNVRQLGVAILSYIQDNDEYLPHRQGPGMVWIYYQIDPYIKNAQCRICPSLNNTSQGYSYGFNWRHCCCDTVAAGWWGKDCNLAQYKTPAETLMLADTTNSQNGAGGADGTGATDFIYCSVCYSTPPYGYTNWALASRHNNGFNACFLDGHGKWMQTASFLGLRTSGTELWGHYTGG